MRTRGGSPCARDLEFLGAGGESWKKKSVEFGIARIGVHAGPALVGNFRPWPLFDYTAHGGGTPSTPRRS